MVSTIIRIAYSMRRVKVSINRNCSTFRNKKHEIHTVKVNKVALNRDDDKQIAKKDRISTLARDHNSLCWKLLTRGGITKLKLAF